MSEVDPELPQGLTQEDLEDVGWIESDSNAHSEYYILYIEFIGGLEEEEPDPDDYPTLSPEIITALQERARYMLDGIRKRHGT